MHEATESKPKGKKFKQTKELIQLASNAGWTQKEIADACRVHQSTVSSWKSGKSKAREDQLQKLLDAFGHKLRRKSFRVYWSLCENEGQKEWTFFRVEGRVIMDHTFKSLSTNEKTGKIRRAAARRRLIVHDQGGGQYLLLQLDRFYFSREDQVVEHSVQDAGWIAKVVDSVPMNKNELIDLFDTRYKNLLEESSCEAEALPYLIRQALLYAGESVDDVIDYPAKA